MSGMIAAAAVVGVGAMAAANQSEIAGRAAMTEQQKMQEEGMNAQERMNELARQDRMPWTEAGMAGLESYQNLMTQEGQAQAYNDYFASPMFAAQQNQASQDVARAQSAQGGLRGGSTYSQLENIAPTLGANYVSGLQNQNLNLANMGMGMAGQNAAGYQQLGSSQANMYNQMGSNQANQMIAAQNAQNQGMTSALGALAGGVTGYLNQPVAPAGIV